MINPKKCTYLGYVISGEGIQTDPENPTNLKELCQWIGVASWYRRFVPSFATIVQPMTALLKKDRKWTWGPEQQTTLKESWKMPGHRPRVGWSGFRPEVCFAD